MSRVSLCGAYVCDVSVRDSCDRMISGSDCYDCVVYVRDVLVMLFLEVFV